ncbi:hypothetical protein H4S02_001707 [Coemansia sp. RSA 2611]|nr:hypothetical protein IWW54_001872 [Coemansia sp. RSA 2705]KAJ2319749.1 hypothetical protein IWW52_001785 [Coemansia sp. RSA 2704]KAJ2367473.1 hypothetical protein H4S01_002144 [Coemansia sp. RSA 2610]KAJ2390715.1 hypothetical protein H4S02_001707 [Coemansia sp. RSA 2611]
MAPKHFAPVWQHYERHEPTGRSKHHRAICKFCAYELSGQPERMKTHLQRCTNCPQHIKHEFAAEDALSSSSTPHSNNFAISLKATEFERAEDEAPAKRIAAPIVQVTEPPAKRRRSIEVGSGAEGLAGLPWAPTANASAIAPAPAAVPPGFQQVYATPATRTPAAPVPAPAPAGHSESPFSSVYENVRGYYSRHQTMNQKQISIGPTVSPHPLIRDAIARVPKAIRDRFYGCGVPLPPGIDGLRVLDLGCGSGRDCYVAARLVGPTGEVVGVDMTDEQLRVAREFVPEYAATLGYSPHLRFVKGYIEFLAQLPELYPGTIDLCISNNAVNLSPNKELVLRSVFEMLREGGEFQFSDIYADRRLPNHVRTHPVLMGECLGGALYTEDFKRLCQRVGFVDARQVSAPAPVRIEAPELRDLVGATQFYSITFRLFKFARPAAVLEPTREDYGQVAVYRGTIEGQRARTRLDSQWAFEAQRPVLVDGNTAVILGESWMRRHFEVRGDRSQHFGGFAAQPPPVQLEPWETDHELEYEIGNGADPVVRRRGIQPLPTPYFLTGLRAQADARSGSASRRASPTRDSPPHTMSLPMPRASAPMREQPFPRLSSFSISQSNVRAENAGLRSSNGPPARAMPADGDPRFVLPVARLAPPYALRTSPAVPRIAVSPAQQQQQAQQAQQSPQQQQQARPQQQQQLTGSSSSGQPQGSSSSVRSGSTASPVAPPLRHLHAPFSSAPSTATRARLSPSPTRRHSPQSVAAAASLS